MPKEKKIIYYDDAVNNDFAGTNIHRCTVDENFQYLHTNPLWKFCAFFLYYCIAFPLVWFYERVILRVRFVNRQAVRPYQKTPYYLYGNHTGFIDAFTPNLISLPRRNHIIVAADTVSIKGLKNIVQMLGAVPIPTQLRGMRQFMEAVDVLHRNCNITIYPEAHIWPYYTGVRPFPDTSFSYPIKHNAPVFAFFTAYSKPSGFLSCFRKANITVYVSDPIFPDEGLTGHQAKKNLRDKVYHFMLEKSRFSDYEVVTYIPREHIGP